MLRGGVSVSGLYFGCVKMSNQVLSYDDIFGEIKVWLQRAKG